MLKFNEYHDSMYQNKISDIFVKSPVALFVIGTPAVGKTTFVKNYILKDRPNFKYISLDDIKLKVPNPNQAKTKRDSILNAFITKRHSFVYDTIGLDNLYDVVLKAKNNGFYVIIVYMLSPKQQTIIQNQNRKNIVDLEFIDYTYDRLPYLVKKYKDELSPNSFYWVARIDNDVKIFKHGDNGLEKIGKVKYVKESKSEILYAFDLDGTLLNSPSVYDILVGSGSEINYNSKVGKVFAKHLKKLNISPDDVVVDSVNKEISFKDGTNALDSQDIYNEVDSLGFDLYPNLLKRYNDSKNKAIITGRPKMTEDKLKKKLKEKGIKIQALYTYPYNENDYHAAWKAEVLTDLSKSYEEINYYDDREDWLNIIYAKLKLKKVRNVNLYLVEKDKIIKKID